MPLCSRLFGCLLVVLFCSSCHKSKLGPCTGNCQVVQFAGVVVDPGAQKPLAGSSVTVYMPRRQSCTLCGSYQVISGKTKADGTFDLTTTVDTTLVVPHSCTISVQAPANYIAYAVPVGPGIGPDAFSGTLAWPLPVDSAGVAPYEEFDFYQPILLTVQLHRTGGIVSSAPALSLSFSMATGSSSLWGLNESSTNADTTLTLYTGANVFTWINAIQFVTDSTVQNQTDSIRCVVGGNNTIEITYL